MAAVASAMQACATCPKQLAAAASTRPRVFLRRDGAAFKPLTSRAQASPFLGCALRQRQPVQPAVKTSRGAGSKGVAQCAYGAVQVGGSVYSFNWIVTLAALVLMLAAKTGLYKQILVPLLALQLPPELVAYMRGEYGLLLACAAVLVRLFYGIPGELELPLATLLLVITAPTAIFAYRSHPAGALLAFAMGSYVAYTHFRETNGMDGAFRGDLVYTSFSVIALFVVPLFFLGRGVYIRT